MAHGRAASLELGPIREPAKNPCGSCPYRRDVPSGVWDESEYDKLPDYDRATGEQPMGMFLCHQQNGRLCAGWVGCHDMSDSLAIRMGLMTGQLSDEVADKVFDYETDVPLFESGTEAAAHGRAEVHEPGEAAQKVVAKLTAKEERRRVRGGGG